MNQPFGSPAASGGGASTVEPLRVVIAEDNEDLRLVLPTLIDDAGDLQCVAVTDSLEEVASLLIEHDAHVAVLDIELKDGSALKRLPSLCLQFPAIRFVIHSGHSNPELIRSARAAGAAAYVLKTGDFDRLYAAIRES
jgi:two-component system, NarL family, response regulator DesR